MKKENLFVILTGVVIGIAALVLTALGNPANMGFCIACFERDAEAHVGRVAERRQHKCCDADDNAGQDHK